MKTTSIPRADFKWTKFEAAITEFTQSLTVGTVEPFVIAEHGKLILDHEDLTLVDDEEIGDIPAEPLMRLNAGHDLFAPFAVFRDFGELACAGGDVIEVPDLDELDEEQDADDEGGEEAPQFTDKQRRLIEATVCNEIHSYGFLIAVADDNLEFQSVLVNESDGECDLVVAEDAGLVDKPMTKFLKLFVRKRSKKARRV